MNHLSELCRILFFMSGARWKPDAASEKQRSWHPWQQPGSKEVLDELVEAIRHSDTGVPVTQVEIQVRRAEFKALIQEAEKGRLQAEAWKPVVMEPTLWELRWYWKSSTPVRAYFHEPSDPNDKTVVGRIHIKEVVKGDSGATNARQDHHIAVARDRITFRKLRCWGLYESFPFVS